MHRVGLLLIRSVLVIFDQLFILFDLDQLIFDVKNCFLELCDVSVALVCLVYYFRRECNLLWII